ncbi:MAG: hypothetical protein ACR2HR_11690 [Euzebya sp.]
MKQRIPLILVLVYCVVLVLSALPLIGAEDGLAGIFLIITTAPWSLIGFVALDALDPELSQSGLGYAPILAGAIINGAIAYLIGRLVRRMVS